MPDREAPGTWDAHVAGMSTSPERMDGIEQVREILVGAIHRDLERKLARLESRFASRLGELQQEARRRTDVIEEHHRTETERLSMRLESELLEIKEALRALTRENREKVSSVEQQVTKLEEGFVRTQHELRQKLLEQAKSFLDELYKTRDELTATMNHELNALELVPSSELDPEQELESHAPREDVEGRSH